MTEQPDPVPGGDTEDSAGHQPSSDQHAAPEGTEPAFALPEAILPTPLPSPHLQASPALDPPWTFSDLILFVAFAGATILVLLTVAGTGFAILKNVFRWTGRPEVVLGTMPVMLSIQLVLEGLCLLFIYFTITAKYRQSFWNAIHWVRRPAQEMPALALGIGLAVVLELFSNLFPPEKPLPVEQWFSSEASAYVVAVMGICVAPFVEELVFRGFFYPVFQRIWGLPAAVFVTGFLFALVHGSQLAWSLKEIIPIFVVGAVLSYLRGRTGSLIPPFLTHVAYNSTLFLSLFASTKGFHNLSG